MKHKFNTKPVFNTFQNMHFEKPLSLSLSQNLHSHFLSLNCAVINVEQQVRKGRKKAN